MTSAKKFKSKIQLQLIAILSIGILVTVIVGAVGWWVSLRFSNTTEALGQNSFVLSQGNLALSNTITRYLERQEHINSAQDISTLEQHQDKSFLEKNFRREYGVLVGNLEGLSTKDARRLADAFSSFNRSDDLLFTHKQTNINLAKDMDKHFDQVLVVCRETEELAQDLTDFVDVVSNQASRKERKRAKRMAEVLVDKNTGEDVDLKSILNLYIMDLESAAQKILLAQSEKELKLVSDSDVLPTFKEIHQTMSKLDGDEISIAGYEKSINAINDNVAKLWKQLTNPSDSLVSSKQKLLESSRELALLQELLDVQRTTLLHEVDQITHSGDKLVQQAHRKATSLADKTQVLIISIGVVGMLVFLLFGHALARRINEMANKIHSHAEEIEHANRVINRALNELKESNQMVTDSISYASKIQRAIMTRERIMRQRYENCFALWIPRELVGGDMYWLRNWGQGHLWVMVDCTGHGVPGAFMTILAKAAVDKAIEQIEPGNVGPLISRIHQIVQSELGQDGTDSDSDDGLDLSVVYVPLDKSYLLFSGARQSLFYQVGDNAIELKGDKQSIGYRGMEVKPQFTEHRIEVNQPTSLYLVSDGLVDQVGGEKNISFGKKRLLSLINSQVEVPMIEQKDAFKRAFKEYRGEQEQRDDITVVGITISLSR